MLALIYNDPNGTESYCYAKYYDPMIYQLRATTKIVQAVVVENNYKLYHKPAPALIAVNTYVKYHHFSRFQSYITSETFKVAALNIAFTFTGTPLGEVPPPHRPPPPHHWSIVASRRHH